MYDKVKCFYGLPTTAEPASFIVIEDDPEAFFTPLEGGKIYFITEGTEEEVFKQIAWDFVFLPFEMVETPGNPSKSPEKMKEIFQKLAAIQLGVHLTASEYQGRGLDILKNILRNDVQSRKGADLFGAFTGIPAIICGGGPSLEKEIETLKNLKNKALIFSGGAGLNTLSHFGIKPHFAAGVDPNPSQSRFFEQSVYETSFFYQSRFNFDQLNSWQGEKLWMEGSGSLPIEEWLFSSTPFDGGWNVATFLVRIAYELGCNPIILAGVDLGSKSKKLYASKIKEEEEGIEFIDEEGTLFYSKNDWIMAGKWLGEFAEQHSRREWINSSRGLKFKGYAQKNLEEIDFKTDYDLEGLCHLHMASATGLKRDLLKFDLLKKSFHKSGELCEKLIQVMERHFPHSIEEKGEYILLEVELEDEVAYEKFLLPVWNVWKYMIEREIEPNVPKAYGINVHRLLFMKRVCDEAKQLSN